ncbi:hypothetical protein CI105_03785 [Candidatus Izimaplasma bacterium ZiA1]|uniref:GGDEF domain-containing protein n=1 Tax=Candidatus Izimoplasma sp. ZiA1 TaxID=2024899 RepID=UPI000BAA4280|nr:hypothetical protein CI105_03785 [Candidatus Izimaplasma bacterium ZiA1]
MLDLRTITFIHPLANLLAILYLYFIYKNGRKYFKAITPFFNGYLLILLGTTLIFLREVIPFVISTTIGNGIIFIGMIFVAKSLSMIYNQKIKPNKLYVLVFIYSLFNIYFTISYDNFTVRVILFSSMFIITTLYAIRVLLKDFTEEKFNDYLMILISLSIFVITYIVRIIFALIYDPGVGFFESSNTEVVLSAISMFNGILLVISFGIMLHNILIRKLDKYHKETEEKYFFEKERAEKDQLSGLNNRSKLEELLDYTAKESLKIKKPFSILFLDIDDFKVINDTFGHAEGDRVLKEVSEVLANSIRETDIIGRWGGDEFLIILRQCDFENAHRIKEVISSNVKEKLLVLGKGAMVSIGISEYNKGITLEDLIKKADENLYIEKNKKKMR